VSPEAIRQEQGRQEKGLAAGDDLFQFDERAGAAASAAPSAPATEPAPADASLRAMGLVDDTLADGPELDGPIQRPAWGPWGRRAPLPPVVVPLLLVVAIANMALVGLTWKSLGREERPSASAEHTTEGPAQGTGEPETHPAQGERHGEALGRGLPHLSASRDEAWAALDDAERTLAAGEFVAARRALYGLLTVLDRGELAERPDIEARAGFLIAESYRLQALSLGDTAAAEEETP
jgi:hypothetical protein